MFRQTRSSPKVLYFGTAAGYSFWRVLAHPFAFGVNFFSIGGLPETIKTRVACDHLPYENSDEALHGSRG